jgi:hypothetical protein
MDVVGMAGADVGTVAGDETATEETGQIVVEIAIVSVVTLPILAGQFVTVGAHEVTVYTDVA